MRAEETTSTSAKILFVPIGVGSSLIAGLVAGQVVGEIYKRVTAGPESDSPKPLESEYRVRQVLVAAALQGAVFAVVKAMTQRGGARLFQRATGEWPGD